MAGGLLQLVAYGAQDQFLTGDPLITFFRAVYRHHTNFSMEAIRQDFNGTVKNGNKVSCTISRNGDLLTDCWLEFRKTDTTSAETSLASFISTIKTVELEIGGQRIDRHTGDWMRIWSELSLPHEKKTMFDRMVNQGQSDIQTTPANPNYGLSDMYTYFVPLQFFFCRNPGLALPLIALQYHEVKVIIEFADYQNPAQPGSRGINKSDIQLDNYQLDLYCNYVYLDVDERKRFATTSHQILIEQLQYTTDQFKSSMRLNFNHPVKELIWVCQPENNEATSTLKTRFGYYEYDGTSSDSFFETAQLKLNNQDRFSERPADYFRLVQPYQYHTRVPSMPIYMYSFALKPEEHQPSGTCNFSRIDNAYLNFGGVSNVPAMGTVTIKVFAVNYNILRITSGMGGLAFSN